MANFSTVKVTNLGRQLINSAIGAGQKVSIVNAKVGSGYPDAGTDPADFSDVLDFQMYATETSSNDQVSYQTTVRLEVSSGNAPVSFQINEIGIFAQIGTQTPILFAYASTSGDGDTITPDPGPDPAIYDYCFLIQYEGDAPVEATITFEPEIQLHGATHRGNGVDPIGLADGTASGALTVLPNDATKVLLGAVPQTFGPIPKHAPTHLDNGTDPIPLATVTRTGLLTKLSGNPGDSLGGDGVFRYQGLPPGIVFDYGGDVAPPGTLLCDGSEKSRTAFPGLFGVIGTKYGPGDGSTTFNLPDSRGRGSIGAGQGAGLTARGVGDIGGEEGHVLIPNELAGHAHTYNDPGHTHVVNDAGHIHTISDPGHIHTVIDAGHRHGVYFSQFSLAERWYNGEPNQNFIQSEVSQETGGTPPQQGTSDSALKTTGIQIANGKTNVGVSNGKTNVTLTAAKSAIGINPAGGDAAHNNMAPFVVFNKIITI